MPQPKSLSFGGRPLPLDIGAIVDGEALGLALAPVQFDFSYLGIRFACRCEQLPEASVLRLVGDAGPMPFSAESPEARAAVQAILDHANATLQPSGAPAFRVGQGRILIGTECRLPTPVTAVSLVTAITRFVIPILPWLGLIAEVVRPPLYPAKPGESALRPAWRRRPAKALQKVGA